MELKDEIQQKRDELIQKYGECDLPPIVVPVIMLHQQAAIVK